MIELQIELTAFFNEIIIFYCTKQHVLIIYCCITIVPQTQQLKAIYTYYFMVSMSQELGLGLTGYYASRSHEAAVKMLARARVSFNTASKLTSLLVVSSSSQVVRLRLFFLQLSARNGPQFPFYVDLPNMTSCFFKTSKGKRVLTRWTVYQSCTSHHFYHVLLLRSNPRYHTYSRGDYTRV